MHKLEPYRHNNQLNFDLCFCSCGYESCLPGHKVGPTIPDYYIFHFIIEGCGTYKTHCSTYNLQAGEGFLLFPGEICYYTPDTKTPWTYYWVGFNGASVETLLKSICTSTKPILQHTNQVIALAKEIHDLSKKTIPLYLKTIQFTSYLYALFYHLSSPLNGAIASSTKQQQYLDYALSYISQTYHKHLTVKEIANYVHIDRTHLFSLFKKAYNISPQQYIINYRMDKAAYLLKHTNITAKEVASSVGYNDYSLFSRIFKKKKGMAPNAFRHSYNSTLKY